MCMVKVPASKVLSSQKTVVYKTEYGLERAWGVT